MRDNPEELTRNRIEYSGNPGRLWMNSQLPVVI